MLGHESLDTYFKNNFNLMNDFNWSLRDIEDMAPWHREVYIGLLEIKLAEEQQ